MENFVKQNWFKLTAAMALVIVAFSVAYFFLIFTPQKEQAVLEQNKQEQKAKDEALQQAADKVATEQKMADQATFAAQNSRASKAALCVKNAETKAVENFYVECVSNPDVGGSTDKCVITENTSLTIRYIQTQKGISFGVFEIDAQLTKDENLCASLYGR